MVAIVYQSIFIDGGFNDHNTKEFNNLVRVNFDGKSIVYNEKSTNYIGLSKFVYVYTLEKI